MIIGAYGVDVYTGTSYILYGNKLFPSATTSITVTPTPSISISPSSGASVLSTTSPSASLSLGASPSSTASPSTNSVASASASSTPSPSASLSLGASPSSAESTSVDPNLITTGSPAPSLSKGGSPAIDLVKIIAPVVSGVVGAAIVAYSGYFLWNKFKHGSDKLDPAPVIVPPAPISPSSIAYNNPMNAEAKVYENIDRGHTDHGGTNNLPGAVVVSTVLVIAGVTEATNIDGNVKIVAWQTCSEFEEFSPITGKCEDLWEMPA